MPDGDVSNYVRNDSVRTSFEPSSRSSWRSVQFSNRSVCFRACFHSEANKRTTSWQTVKSNICICTYSIYIEVQFHPFCYFPFENNFPSTRTILAHLVFTITPEGRDCLQCPVCGCQPINESLMNSFVGKFVYSQQNEICVAAVIEWSKCKVMEESNVYWLLPCYLTDFGNGVRQAYLSVNHNANANHLLS